MFLLMTAILVAMAVRSTHGAVQEESNASMRSVDEAQRGVRETFARDFGGDEIIVVTLTHPDMLGREGLVMLGEMTRRVAALDGVRRATSLCNVRQLVHGPDGAEPAPLIPSTPASEPAGAALIRRALDANPHLTGLLISEDRRTAAIMAELEDREGDDGYRARIVENLRAMQAEPGPDGVEVHLTGITLQKYDTTRLARRDRMVMLPLSVLMLAGSLAVVTRSVAGVLLPLLVTGVTVILTLGLYTAMGFRINIITSLLPPLLLVLSVTTVIHLFEEWVALGGEVMERPERLRRILGFFAAPCFMTSLTTAIGLGSLAVNDIPAVRQFGLFGAFGIMLSFAVNFTLLPAILTLMDPPARRTRPAGQVVASMLDAAARWSVHRPAVTLLLAGVPTVLALAGLPMITNNTDLLSFLRQDEPLVKDTRFIDQAMGGANAIDLSISRKDGNPMTDVEDVRRLGAFEREVRRLGGVTGAFGLADLLSQLHRAETGGDTLALPETQAEVADLFDLLDAADDDSDIRRVLTADARRTRITVRLHSMGTRQAAALLSRVDSLATASLGPGIAAIPTGAFHQITVDSNRLVAGQVKSFGLALGLVLLVIGLTLRSGRLLIAAILPNVIPILWTLGIMGWLGIDLSTATTMVASVVLGIAVDDAIHYLARFRRQYNGDLEGAVRRTTQVTGRVLVITTTVLTLGFWVGALSSFKPTVYFSLLSGLTMITALLCTVTLLPACLRVLHAEAGRGR